MWRKYVTTEVREHSGHNKKRSYQLTMSTQAVVKVLHADPCEVNGDHSEDQVNDHYQFKRIEE